MQVSIQGDDGRELKPFETGEICVIGPGVFAGYYDNPEANAKAFRDGWFRTGDLGHMDDEGFVYITGRASDMYISGGSNIYPREVEEKILTHPAIGEVAVLGVPDPVWGEVGVAVCVAREGAAAVTEAELAGVPVAEGAALQDAEAVLLLGCAAEVRLRQDAEAAGARRARGAGLLDLASKTGHLGMRSIAQPGRAGRPSASSGSRRGAARFRSRCEAGLPLLEAARRGFAAAGFAGGVLSMRAGALGPFAYVMPALSKTGANAAFYSDTFRPAGITRLKMRGDDLRRARRRAVLSLPWAVDRGRRPSAWRPHPARGDRCRRTLRGRRVRHRRRDVRGGARPRDQFQAVRAGRARRRRNARSASRAFALRLRPNQDFAAALETFCRQRGIFRARMHGGVGSTIGAHFTDGRTVEPFATELAIRPAASRRTPTAR